MTEPSVPLHALVSALVRGDALSDAQAQALCDTVFLPCIRENYEWLRDVAQLGRGAGSGNAADEEDGEVRDEDVSDAESDDPEDPFGGWRSRFEKDAPRSSGDASEPCSARSKAGPDPVISFGVNSLWDVFSREDPKAGRKSKWRSAFDAVDPAANPDARDEALRRYLRTVARHEMHTLLTADRVSVDLHDRLRKALASPEFTCWGGETSERRLYQLAGCPDNLPGFNGPVRDAFEGIRPPEPTGKSRTTGSSLPTPLRIREFIIEVMKKTSSSFLLSTLRELVAEAYGIREAHTVGFAEDAQGEENTGRHATAGVREIDLATGRDVYSGFSYPGGENEPGEPNMAERVAGELIEAVEAVDGCPADPPPKDRKQGKMARLLLEYALYHQWPVSQVGFTRYTMQLYEAHSGYSNSSEGPRLKKLMDIIDQIRSSQRTQVQHVANAFVLLRMKYTHRRPEFVRD